METRDSDPETPLDKMAIDPSLLKQFGNRGRRTVRMELMCSISLRWCHQEWILGLPTLDSTVAWNTGLGKTTILSDGMFLRAQLQVRGGLRVP